MESCAKSKRLDILKKRIGECRDVAKVLHDDAHEDVSTNQGFVASTRLSLVVGIAVFAFIATDFFWYKSVELSDVARSIVLIACSGAAQLYGYFTLVKVHRSQESAACSAKKRLSSILSEISQLENDVTEIMTEMSNPIPDSDSVSCDTQSVGAYSENMSFDSQRRKRRSVFRRKIGRFLRPGKTTNEENRELPRSLSSTGLSREESANDKTYSGKIVSTGSSNYTREIHRRKLSNIGEEVSPYELSGNGESESALDGQSSNVTYAEKINRSTSHTSTINITDEFQIVPSDIIQPECQEESELLEQLRCEVADIVDQGMVEQYGGEIRCYQRFLRARNGVVADAAKMFRETAAFRKERSLDDHQSPITIARCKAFEESRHIWAGQFMDFTTHDGSPIQVFRFRHLKPKQLMKSITEADFADFYVTWMEKTLELQNIANSRQYQSYLRNRFPETVSPAGGQYEWKAFIEIHDLSGISISHLHMPAINMLSRVLKIGQFNYPENLRACFIVNAPWIFNTAWSILRCMIDADTKGKIVLTKNVPRNLLLEWLTEDQLNAVFPDSKSSKS